MVGFGPTEVAWLLDPSTQRVRCSPGLAVRPVGDWLALVSCPDSPERKIEGVVRMGEQRQGFSGASMIYTPDRRIRFARPIDISLDQFRTYHQRQLAGDLLVAVRQACSAQKATA